MLGSPVDAMTTSALDDLSLTHTTTMLGVDPQLAQEIVT